MKKNNKDTEFMSHTNSAVLQTFPVKAHFILWTTLFFLIVITIWAANAHIDEITRGEGKVVPSSEMQIVQNLDGGVVKKILAKEGQIVKKDQLLMVIDDTRFVSSVKEAKSKMYSLQTRIARLTAEADGTPLDIPQKLINCAPDIVEEETQLYHSRQKELNVRTTILMDELKEKQQELLEIKNRQKQLQRSYNLVKKELQMTYPLVKEGAVSKVELIRLERSFNDIKGELSSNSLSIPRIETGISSAEKKIEEIKIGFSTESQTQLNQVTADLNALLQSKVALEDKVSRTEIRSPVSGTVNQILVNTIGGIVQPGQDLVEIVPLGDTLLVEADINPKDIGFIRYGLPAKVKVTAFDFSIYGGLEATVENISADTVLNDKEEHVYQIKLRTNKSHLERNGKTLKIIPGMRVSVDILTGQKTILGYLLKPIIKTKHLAMTEK